MYCSKNLYHFHSSVLFWRYAGFIKLLVSDSSVFCIQVSWILALFCRFLIVDNDYDSLFLRWAQLRPRDVLFERSLARCRYDSNSWVVWQCWRSNWSNRRPSYRIRYYDQHHLFGWFLVEQTNLLWNHLQNSRIWGVPKGSMISLSVSVIKQSRHRTMYFT